LVCFGAVNMMGATPVTGIQLKPTPKPQQQPVAPKQTNTPLVALIKTDSQEVKSKPPPAKPVAEEPKPKPKPPIPKSTSIPEDLSSKVEKPNQNSKAIDLIKEEIFLLSTLKQKSH